MLELAEDPQEELDEAEESLNTEELKSKIKTVVDELEREDESARDFMLKRCKRNEYFWNGIQRLFWDPIASDWGTPENITEAEANEFGVDLDALNAVVNKYRAHGESIIAALSAGLPVTRFFPADADNPNDVLTSRAYTKISEKIQNDNQAMMLFVRALFTLYTQPFAAAYIHHEDSFEYGEIEVPRYEARPYTKNSMECSECGEEINSTEGFDVEAPMGEMQPQECPRCNMMQTPLVNSETEEKPFLAERVKAPKGREIIDVYGPINIRVPHNIRKFRDAGYITLEQEVHYAKAVSLYPDLKKKVIPGGNEGDEGKYTREPTNPGDYGRSSVTARYTWLRPWTYYVLGHDETGLALLQSKYPEGLLVIRINDEVAEIRPELMDEHWEITESPLSNHIHAEEIGNPMIPIQIMLNDLTYLTLDTIKHEIPVVFADPSSLDFKSYRKSEAQPGSIIPAIPRQGQGLDNSFYSVKPASLSQEVGLFAQSLDRDGQFVLGSLPSIWGGVNSGGSKTFAEYELSRNQALQRLSTIWKMLNSWWNNVMFKASNLYVRNAQGDEKFVRANGNDFINVWIRISELSGKVGRVEPETSEQFPTSWNQQRAAVAELMALNKAPIDAALFYPQNTGLMRRLFGLNDLVVPGEADHDAQLMEIAELLKSAPTEGPPQMMPDPMTGMPVPGEPQIMPSIPIDPDLDDNAIHLQVCREWLISPAGYDAKLNNPEGYANVLAHFKMHLANQPPPMPMMPEGENPEMNPGAPPPAPGGGNV